MSLKGFLGKDLPIEVRPVESRMDFRDALNLRVERYRREFPDFAISGDGSDSYDFARNSLILIARSKADDHCVGSLRITNSVDGKLECENYAAIPESVRGADSVEGSRFCTVGGKIGMIAQLALVKAGYIYCMATQIYNFVACTRPRLEPFYRFIGFDDPVEGPVELVYPNLGNTRHRLLVNDMRSAERRWFESGNELYEFMGRWRHPEIRLFNTYPSAFRPVREVRGMALPIRPGIVDPTPSAAS